MKNYTITVKTLEGLESVLSEEIRQIGGININIGNRAVFFEGDLAMVYRANYRLRTALRVFRQIDTFRFNNVDDFYLKCLRMKWESLMNLNQTFSIQSTVFHSDIFKNSMFASLKVKDAIADRFRQRFGSRPDVDTQAPDIIFNVHISNDQATISLDSSGESLHKRGYRQVQGDAPLSEVLAAGMILMTGWDGSTDFLDPMCGSGTLPIEAALIARNIPPGKYRKTYSFMSWKDYDSDLFEKIKQEPENREFTGKIYASDILNKNILASQSNARSARVYNLIQFEKGNFADLNLPLNNATLIMNPPYGERLVLPDLESLYTMIGERLKHQYTSNQAWILSSSANLIHRIGLKPSLKVDLLNGSIECTYQKYELFEGKRIDRVVKKRLM
ncbi:MAG TPA: RNA methyltransferase [Prolixibacteraceae bacterium]|nr:RNA methyltransferase [Prolixibacteraceae bacterium]